MSVTKLRYVVLTGIVLAIPSLARAQDTAACTKAYSDFQSLKDQSQLIEARDKLKICAQASCGEHMPKDCTNELASLEPHIPTVVFSARDSDGKDLPDASVANGGTALAAHLDGHPVAMNPGRYVFTFTLPDGRTHDETVLIKDGEKSRVVVATFEAPKRAVESPAVTPEPTAAPAAPSNPAPPAEESGGSTMKTLGYVAGGVGIAALAVGTIFGIKAINSKNDAQCNSSNQCVYPDKADAGSGNIATVGFIAGGALLAGGITLIILAPSGKGSVQVSPTAARNGAGLTIGGAW